MSWCCCKWVIAKEKPLKEPLMNQSVSVRIDSLDYLVSDIRIQKEEEVNKVISEVIDELLLNIQTIESE